MRCVICISRVLFFLNSRKQTCPNRKKGLNPDLSKYDDCDRCGSRLHKTNVRSTDNFHITTALTIYDQQECPTLWRLYEYFTDQDKDHIVRIREERKHLTLGQGGEGYIASDEWCYNCGSCGHWGDVSFNSSRMIVMTHC